MSDEPQTEAEIFRSLACELAHLDNPGAWRVIQQWLDRQRPRYRYHFREASTAIWDEYRRARRIFLMQASMPKHILRDQDSGPP
jgi:hypothetical protein